jgi:hypothetical protein
MAVGFPSDKTAVDARSGDLARRTRDLFTDIERMDRWLAGQTNQELEALGYTAEDVTLLRAAMTDLNALRLVATGQEVGPTAINDFLFWSNQILGVN